MVGGEYSLFVIPLFAYVILILRTVIGIKTFGVFAPVIIALTFIFSSNPLLTLITYLGMIFVGVITLILIKKFHFQRISENVLVLFTVSLYLWGINSFFDLHIFNSEVLLPMITSINIFQNYVRNLDESSFKEANRALLRTIGIAFLLLLLEIVIFKFYMSGAIFPLFLLVFIFAFATAFYKGPRISELTRFKHVN